MLRVVVYNHGVFDDTLPSVCTFEKWMKNYNGAITGEKESHSQPFLYQKQVKQLKGQKLIALKNKNLGTSIPCIAMQQRNMVPKHHEERLFQR